MERLISLYPPSTKVEMEEISGGSFSIAGRYCPKINSRFTMIAILFAKESRRLKNKHSMELCGETMMEKAGAYRIYGLAPGRTYSMVRRKTDIDNIITDSNDVDIYLIEGFTDHSWTRVQILR